MIDSLSTGATLDKAVILNSEGFFLSYVSVCQSVLCAFLRLGGGEEERREGYGSISSPFQPPPSFSHFSSSIREPTRVILSIIISVSDLCAVSFLFPIFPSPKFSFSFAQREYIQRYLKHFKVCLLEFVL